MNPKKKPDTVAPLEEEKQPVSPPVRQVIEVVEETPEASTHLEEGTEEGKVQVSVPPENAGTTREDEEADAKRKVLVDELFEKNRTPAGSVGPEISMHKKTSKAPVILWAVVIIAACIGIGTGIIVFSGKTPSFPSIVALSTPTPTPSPTSAPTPTTSALDRSSLTIQVLNGGGKAGAASEMKKLLEEKGYVVTDTGNAGSFTYESTEILVIADSEEFLALLTEDIEGSYTVGTSAATLDDAEDYDVRITVGKE